MGKIGTVMEIIIPIFVVLFLGIFARRKAMITQEENRGLQQFVIKFGLPCILFNSCFTASIGLESLTTMVMILPMILLGCFWAFLFGKKKYPYHNLPFMFSIQESGMLGIPLFVALFGAGQAYRVGVLDLAQSFVAIPLMSVLSCDMEEQTSIPSMIREIFRSPLLLMSLLGLVLNLTGIGDLLANAGIAQIMTETTGFVAEPVSAVILFTVGYNFSLGEGSRNQLFKLAALHFAVFMGFGLISQALLFLVPSVELETRIAVLLYFALPCSFLTSGFGKNQEEYRISAGVSALLTAACLIVFCGIAVFVA